MSLVMALRDMVRRDRSQPLLRFDKAQERRFIESTQDARIQHFMASGVVALAIFNLFLISDWLMAPDTFWLAASLRLLVFTPLSLVVLYMPWRQRAFVRALPARVLEAVVVANGVGAALCLTAVLMATESPYAGMYRCGLLPILVYGTLVQRFRFRFALVFAACVVACHLATVGLAVGQSVRTAPYPEIELPAFLVLVIVAAYTLLMNFKMEKEERHRFQQKERQALLRTELEASQAQMAALSRQDALTGVPNRRCFDELALVQWRQHERSGERIAVLLVDVDHFKAYNDHHGHPAGDQCLRLVAQELQRVLRGEPDVAMARWGGEEFIVLLPHADVALTEAVAARLCAAVRGLGLRHGGGGVNGVVTISVGAALACPAVDRKQLPAVAGQADEALYRAKRDGRDRCCVAAVEAVAGGVR